MAEPQQRVVCDSCCQREIPYEFLRIHEQLTPTDLKQNLKNGNIVEVYSRTCTPIQKTLFGCDKDLKGPEYDLWIDPENRISDEEGEKFKLKLTPENNTEKVKALTHQGILRIGGEIESRINDENSKLIEKTINETLEVAKFEADARIKFHIESVTRKLNAEWESRMDELRAQLEARKSGLIKSYENGVTEVAANLCQRWEVEDFSISSIDSRAYGFFSASENNATKMLMDLSTRGLRNSASEEEDEQKNFYPYFSPAASRHDQMEFTRQIINSEQCNVEKYDDKIEKMKNECLKALDLQRELMLCRHVTEIMHMMAVIRQQDKTHREKLRNDVDDSHAHEHDENSRSNKFQAENKNNSHWHHQSKSIKLYSSENGLPPKVNKSDEEKITDELDSKPQSRRRSIDYDGQGGESSDPQVELDKVKLRTSLSSLNGNNDESKLYSEESSKQSVIRNSFVDAVLNRFVSHHISSSLTTIEPFTSQRENDYDEKKSNPPPFMEIMGREKAKFDPSTADVDVILLPKASNAEAAVSRMKDSLENSSSTSQRVVLNYNEKQTSRPIFTPETTTEAERHNLLATVDSLELLVHHAKHLTRPQSSSTINLSKKTEKTEVAREQTMRRRNTQAEENCFSNELMLRKLPPYMTRPSPRASASSMHKSQVPNNKKNRNDSDMDQLAERHNQGRRRSSSVRFSGDSLSFDSDEKTSPSSTPKFRPRHGSILRKPPTTSKSMSQTDHLNEIHEKCYEGLDKMKISEILKLLSE